MASCTEWVINFIQPIERCSDASVLLRTINAKLAVYAGLGFIGGWHEIDFYLGSGIEPLNDSIDRFINDRIGILSSIDLEDNASLLLNAQTWDLLNLIYQYFRSIAMIR